MLGVINDLSRFHVSSPPSVTDSDIVPEGYQNALITIRDSMTDAYFAIGDIANTIIVENAKTGFRITDQRIYSAVGKYCGKSGRTVRYYAETAAFYPIDVRQNYEMIPFSFFVFARSFPGDKWEDILDYAAYNTSITLEALRVKYVGVMESEPDDDEDIDKRREISQDYRVSGYADETLGSFADLNSELESSENSGESKNGFKSELSQSFGRQAVMDGLSVIGSLANSLRNAGLVVEKIPPEKLPDKDEILDLIFALSGKINGLVAVVQ